MKIFWLGETLALPPGQFPRESFLTGIPPLFLDFSIPAGGRAVLPAD